MDTRTSLKKRTAGIAILVVTVIFSGCNDPAAESRGAGGESPSAPVSTDTMSDYLAVQESLAGDTLEGVDDSALALSGHFAGAGDENAAEAARLIGVTDDLEEARRQFETVSVALLARLRDGGVAEGEYREAHCPMAFGNSGASWVQAGTTVNNPYFGSQMQTCGAIRETFAAAGGDAGHYAN